MKESFVIYTKYEEQINMLSDEQAGVLLRALIKYQKGAELPEMDGIIALAFSFIKQQIDFDNQKYEDICKARSEAGKQGAEFGKLGGRPTKRAKTAKGDSETAKTAKGVSKTPYGFSKTAKTAESDNDKESDISPLFIPPHGEETKTAEAVFFEKYPKYAKDRAKARKDFDYKRLLEEFEKSTYLRSLYTFKQVTELYPLIVTGEFRDKEKSVPKDERTEAINAKAKRDRWYETRRVNAELQAEYIHDRFMKDEEFRRIERRLSAMESELARAEIGAENGEAKAQKELVKLTQEQGRLRQQRLGIIERNGLTEEDLLPKWHCRKCSDTGYLSDGRACDCYLKEQEGG